MSHTKQVSSPTFDKLPPRVQVLVSSLRELCGEDLVDWDGDTDDVVVYIRTAKHVTSSHTRNAAILCITIDRHLNWHSGAVRISLPVLESLYKAFPDAAIDPSIKFK